MKYEAARHPILHAPYIRISQRDWLDLRNAMEPTRRPVFLRLPKQRHSQLSKYRDFTNNVHKRSGLIYGLIECARHFTRADAPSASLRAGPRHIGVHDHICTL
jgi:hypothetical protein